MIKYFISDLNEPYFNIMVSLVLEKIASSDSSDCFARQVNYLLLRNRLVTPVRDNFFFFEFNMDVPIS